MSPLEILGYAASALVAVSLTMTSVLRLRMINLAGSLAFLAYGVLIEAWPVAVVNGFIAVVNVVFLRHLLGDEGRFEIMEVHPRSSYLARFLGRHGGELEAAHPGSGVAEDDLCWFVMDGMHPAGLFVGRRGGRSGDLVVAIDFAAPDYRDLRVARFLYGSELDRLVRDRGIDRFVVRSFSDEHARYLRRVGYELADGDLVLPI